MALLPFQMLGRASPSILTTLAVSGLMILWLRNVNAVVPAPYLDEVFHARQAQAYWEHRWRQWDPKITTPPGLYVVSYLIGIIVYSVFRYPLRPHVSDFRCVNGMVLFNLLPTSLRSVLNSLWIEKRPSGTSARKGSWTTRLREWELNFTVLNICLFPPIFFFSGLYYTDLAALLITLHMYSYDLSREHRNSQVPRSRQKSSATNSPLWQSTSLFIYGVTALVFRQTNVFWTVVFLGGLRAVKTLSNISADCKSSETLKIVRSSWSLHQVFDPPVSGASFEDYLKTAISLGVAILANIRIMLVDLVPYLLILGAFGLFVLWNGGVVLGHKEFHTASIHLPQMLYIWPYFAFFSWPVLLAPWLILLRQFSSTAIRSASILPRWGVILCSVAVMLATVHLNTIVHPFTLADNRHYVFYVFRILLRHPAIKYVVVPIYFTCAWLTLSASGPLMAHVRPAINRTSSRANSDPANTTKGVASVPASQISEAPIERQTRVSFVLVWILSTSLSLITAPLVEPRYFIIPWVMWRVHIPPTSTFGGYTPTTSSPNDKVRAETRNADNDEMSSSSLLARFAPLVVEFLWFLSINVVTGYVFLYKGFEWPQEPGQVQRFMW